MPEALPRRLVVCFDGTWNSPDQGGEPTNVVKLVRAIRNLGPDGRDQVVFYDKGVGTAGTWDRLKGGLFGSGLEANVIDGYRFLANNYEPGDEIYVFGFSRGAYTARSLAGFVGAVGLFHPVCLGGTLRKALAIKYERIAKDEKARRIAELPNLRRHEVIPIKCVGVFDTVGARGIPGKPSAAITRHLYEFNDVQLSPRVAVALHALAIDEKRGPFQPTLWEYSEGERALPPGQTVEQVWFPGVHSNVGGSYPDTGLSDIAMQWMVRRVQTLTGLDFDREYLDETLKPDIRGQGYESRSALYARNRLWPSVRAICAGGRDAMTIGEAIHVSALERSRAGPVFTDCKLPMPGREKPYRPENLEAVIAAAKAGDAVPVVGWEGAELDPADVDWPRRP